MFEFFRGWKRKLGCVTLGLACVTTAGWIRSFSHCDGYQWPGADPAFHVVYSVPNWVGWVTVANTDGHFPKHRRDAHDLIERPPGPPFPESSRPYALIYGPLKTDHELAQNFEAGTRLSLPYWSIVVPLTALSAGLLLSKPRFMIESAITHVAKKG